MSKFLRRFSICLGLVLMIALAQACRYTEGTHRSYSRSAAKDHFYRNTQAFQSLANDWLTEHENDNLVYRPWHMGEVSWNGISILEKDAHYVVQEGVHKGRDAATFDEAAKLVGADPSKVAAALASIRKLDVSFLHVRKRGSQKTGDYLLVGLQQAGANYGYVYVPAGNEEAQNLLSGAAQNRPDLIDMERVEQLAPHWFYFEGK